MAKGMMPIDSSPKQAVVEKGPVRFAWVSTAEGRRFTELVQQVTEEVRPLGPAKRLAKKTGLGQVYLECKL